VRHEFNAFTEHQFQDKHECAKAIVSLFAAIGLTHQQALEIYQEAYTDPEGERSLKLALEVPIQLVLLQELAVH